MASRTASSRSRPPTRASPSIQKLVDQAKSVANQALSTQITTTGTASQSYTASSTASTINLFVNGKATAVSLSIVILDRPSDYTA